MKWKTVYKITQILVILLLGLAINGSSATRVEFSVRKKLQLDSEPMDVAISQDGEKIFILTNGGEVQIYSSAGNLIDSVDVGKEFDRINLVPGHEKLLLKSRGNKLLQVVDINYIHSINISGAPFKGPEDAEVVIAVFDDFQCPYCARLVPTFRQLLENNPKDIRIVFKNFPLRNHKFAVQAATAALAAGKQGKFWEFHDLLFENYKKLNDQMINKIAIDLGLNMDQFQSDLKDPEIVARIKRDIQEGRQIGVKSIPSIFLNGKKLKNRSLKSIQSEIDNVLKE